MRIGLKPHVTCTGSVWEVQCKLHVWAANTSGGLLPDHVWTLPGRASLTGPAASSTQPLHLHKHTTRLRLHLPAAGALGYLCKHVFLKGFPCLHAKRVHSTDACAAMQQTPAESSEQEHIVIRLPQAACQQM